MGVAAAPPFRLYIVRLTARTSVSFLPLSPALSALLMEDWSEVISEERVSISVVYRGRGEWEEMRGEGGRE
jgi:hypothetical protein